MPWVRALLLMPAALFGLLLIAGKNGHTAIPFDAVSGGKAPWQMMAMMSIYYFGMMLFATSLLIAYAAFAANGISLLRGEFRKRTILLLVSMVAGYIMIWYVGTEVRNEIAAAGLKIEKIEAGQWGAISCGRGQYVCVDVEGSLGKARIKAYIGGSAAANSELGKWARAAKSKEPVAVEWGRTPAGWNAARSAACGEIKLQNGWL